MTVDLMLMAAFVGHWRNLELIGGKHCSICQEFKLFVRLNEMMAPESAGNHERKFGERRMSSQCAASNGYFAIVCSHFFERSAAMH